MNKLEILTFLWLLSGLPVNLSGQDFAIVGPGEFTVGTDDQKISLPEDRPAHLVRLSKAFKISKKLITFDELTRVLDWGSANGKLWHLGNTYYTPWFGKSVFSWDYLVLTAADNLNRKPISSLSKSERKVLPAIDVTWYCAAIYCNLRSEMEGLAVCYDYKSWTCNFSANGYRIPTEAEWCWAYQGGPSSKGYTYSGGNLPWEVGWYYDNARGLKPVGLLKPNELGLYDMSGNVSEWTNDWFGHFSQDIQNDPIGPARTEYTGGDPNNFGKVHVKNGLNTEATGMLPRREMDPPERGFWDVGFRIARN